MIAVAIGHITAALMLMLGCPLLSVKGNEKGYRLAGIWAMTVMAGAEYCTRKIGFVSVGFPKEYQNLRVLITTGTHVVLFLFGACMALSEFRGGLIVMLRELLESTK